MRPKARKVMAVRIGGDDYDLTFPGDFLERPSVTREGLASLARQGYHVHVIQRSCRAEPGEPQEYHLKGTAVIDTITKHISVWSDDGKTWIVSIDDMGPEGHALSSHPEFVTWHEGDAVRLALKLGRERNIPVFRNEEGQAPVPLS